MYERMHKKLQFEKERLMNAKKVDFIDTFEKFLDYKDHDEEELPDDGKFEAIDKKKCSYCKNIILDTSVDYGWRNAKG